MAIARKTLLLLGTLMALAALARADEAAAAKRSQRVYVGPRRPRPPPGVHSAIVGGATAPIGRFKHQVGMYDYGFACGGTLVRPDVVVGAAHCFNGFEPDLSGMDFTVGAHGAFYYDDFGGGVPIKPSKVVVHPDYTGYNWDGTNENDIAVVFLSQCAPLSDTVQPIPLATTEEFEASKGSVWAVSGWGSTSRSASNETGMGGAFAEELQYGLVRHVDDEAQQCKALVKGLDATMLCAGTIPTTLANGPPVQDSCQGDSGGPLIFNTAEAADPVNKGATANDRLVGVVSWGYGCGLDGYPGIYSRATALRAWVAAQIDAAPSPCAPAGASRRYAAVSADRNFKGQPDQTRRLPPGQSVDACKELCLKRATRPAASPAGCAAFSVSAAPRKSPGRAPARYCNMWARAVPARVCRDGDADALCAQDSEGSYRVVFAR